MSDANPPQPKGFYVYLLIDPRNGEVFYVGKGKGKRYAAHVKEWAKGQVKNHRKFSRISGICSAGLNPEVRIKADGLSETDALRLERETIAELRATITNHSPGQFSELERSQAQARDALSRFIDFDIWRAARNASFPDQQMYWRIWRELVQCAIGDLRLRMCQ